MQDLGGALMDHDTEIRVLRKRYQEHQDRSERRMDSLENSERAHNRRIRALEVSQHYLTLIVAVQAMCSAGIVCMALTGVI